MSIRAAMVGLALMGCGRATPRATIAATTDARAALDAASVVAIRSATCQDFMEFSNAMREAQRSGASSISCWTDAGVALSIALDRGSPSPRASALILQRVWRGFSEADRREALALVEREQLRGNAASLERFESDRAQFTGRIGRVDGRIVEARASGDECALTVEIDGRARQTLSVVFPSTAERWMVPGARARVYGLWGEHNGAQTMFAATIIAR